MPADIDHAKIVQALTESHEKRLLNILKQLEEQVASLVMSAPTSDKQLFDLKWAIDARADLERIMRDTYLTEVDSQVRDYDQIVASMETMLNDYTDYTGLDPEIVSQLKRVSFQGFEDIASTFSNDLAEELYQSTLTGRDMAESVRNMRQKINGVYIASDDAEIERLVELAQAGDESAVRELHQKYAADRAGNNMRRYARQMVFDSAMQFDASINVAAGKDIGADRWKYYGSVITDTRPWCAKHAGKTLSEEYIREQWPKNNWKGKADGDPFIVRGGYNCRHHFRPAFDFEDITEPKEEEAVAPKKATVGYLLREDETTFSNGYDRDKYVSALNKLHPDQIKLANALPVPKQVKDGRGYYQAIGSTLSSSPNEATTIRHEYGHHIDNVLTKHPSMAGMRGVWWSMQDEGFKAAYDSDRKALGLHRTKTRQAGIWQVWQEIYDQEQVEVRGRTVNKYTIKDRDLSGISDILDSLSQGEVHTKYSGWGHGRSYYSSKNSYNRHLENFANLWALYGSKHWPTAQKHFPSLTKRFTEVMEMVNG